jgi:hypothetical protein
LTSRTEDPQSSGGEAEGQADVVSKELEDGTNDTGLATTEDTNAAVANAHIILLSIQEQGRTIDPQGTTMEAFQQAANNMPWIPFQEDDSTMISREERNLFERMYKDYNRHVTP